MKATKEEMLLIKQCCDGDEEAWKKLFSQHHETIKFVCMRLHLNPQDFEDVIQDIKMRVMEKLHTFKGTSSLKTWIYKVGYNLILMKFRKSETKIINSSNSNELEIELENRGATRSILHHCFYPTVFRDMQNQEQKELLTKAIDILPAEARIICALRYKQNLEVKQIAVIVNKSVRAVKSHIFRSRPRLKITVARLVTNKSKIKVKAASA